MTLEKGFSVKAPGRLCLFGEHSDYIGLNVIPAALDQSISISAHPRTDDVIHILYPNISQKDEFNSGEKVKYRHKRDYLRSAYNRILSLGGEISRGWNLEVSGDIPIAAGLSSSSALSVAAVKSFSFISGIEMSRMELVKQAFTAEVLEFGESGGMQDHLASVFGGVIHLDFSQDLIVTELPARIMGIVIGDSEEKKKDTVGDIRKIRTAAEEGFQILSELIEGFNRSTTPLDSVLDYIESLPSSCSETTETVLRNRDLTNKALGVLLQANPDLRTVGNMLNDHHRLLRDGLHRSTKKIERLISASIGAGALGCKINGSGGGGTMMALAPGHEKEVAKTIENVGGTPYIVEIGQGISLTISK